MRETVAGERPGGHGAECVIRDASALQRLGLQELLDAIRPVLAAVARLLVPTERGGDVEAATVDVDELKATGVAAVLTPGASADEVVSAMRSVIDGDG